MVGHHILHCVFRPCFQRPSRSEGGSRVPVDPPAKQECKSEPAGRQPCRAGRRMELAVAPCHGMVMYEPVSEGPAGWRGAGHRAGCKPCCDMSSGCRAASKAGKRWHWPLHAPSAVSASVSTELCLALS